MEELDQLYYKYESLFNEKYDGLLNKFYEESYLKNKMYKGNNGEMWVTMPNCENKPLRRLTFEDIKGRILQIWVNKQEDGDGDSLKSDEVMDEIINSVTLYYIAREVRKTLTSVNS